jgi:surface antigen
MFRRVRHRCRLAPAVLLCLTLAACAARHDEQAATTTAAAQGPLRSATHVQPSQASHARPRIVTPQRRLQCVPYARQVSHIEIRGDAWTWWGKAKGRYQRGRRPAVGSVLVLRRKGGSRGHLAVVTRIVSDREIVTTHANWLNRGRIHIDTPIRDVSPNNDWSAVRVWYTPGKVLGKSVYPAYGFVYPPARTAAN